MVFYKMQISGITLVNIAKKCLSLTSILLGIFVAINFTVSGYCNEITNNAATTNSQDILTFTPPANWKITEQKLLPQNVEMLAIGQSKTDFPPSLNLATEPYEGTTRSYLKIVKAINDADGVPWKDLGTVQTKAGKASLSQSDERTQWGDVRMMHLIMVYKGVSYIITAAALKKEFSYYYNDFFTAMTSLHPAQNK